MYGISDKARQMLTAAPPPAAASLKAKPPGPRWRPLLVLALAVVFGAVGAQLVYNQIPANAIELARAFVVQSAQSLRHLESESVQSAHKFDVVPKGIEEKLRKKWKGVTG